MRRINRLPERFSVGGFLVVTAVSVVEVGARWLVVKALSLVPGGPWVIVTLSVVALAAALVQRFVTPRRKRSGRATDVERRGERPGDRLGAGRSPGRDRAEAPDEPHLRSGIPFGARRSE